MALPVEGGRERPDVLDQHRGSVGVQLGRFLGGVEATLVGRHRKVIAPELLQLGPPGVPELGEPVEEEDQRALTLLDVMKADPVDRSLSVDHGSSLSQRWPSQRACEEE